MKIKSIAKNTSYLTFALIIQKTLTFAYFTILARELGPEQLGKYYFAISFTTMIAIVIDLGLANILTREVSRVWQKHKDYTEEKKQKIQKLLGNVVAIKLPLSFLALSLAIVIINLIQAEEITKQLVYISCLCMVLDSFTSTFFAATRGLYNLIFESMSAVIFPVSTLILGLIAIYNKLDLRFIMGALAIASIVNFSYSFLVLKFQWHLKVWPNFNKKGINLILKLIAPFAFFGIFQRIYTYLDTVLLSTLASDFHAGLYQVAFKIVFALQFLPLAFIASLYPAMSSYWLNNKKQLAVSFERAMNYLIIISLPISIGIIFLADKIILIFKSGYSEAVLPMQIIIASLLFVFINYPIGSLLNACDKQKINTRNMIIVTIVSVILNLILIPHWQVVGASITVLVTNFLMFVLGIYWVPKIIDYSPWAIVKIFLKSFLAGLIMGGSVFFLKNQFNIFLVVMLGGIIYFISLFLVKGFTKDDIKSILVSFKK